MGVGTKWGWKTEHVDIATNNLGKLINQELSINSKIKEIIIVVQVIIN